jgi:hypothetical protein
MKKKGVLTTVGDGNQDIYHGGIDNRHNPLGTAEFR